MFSWHIKTKVITYVKNVHHVFKICLSHVLKMVMSYSKNIVHVFKKCFWKLFHRVLQFFYLILILWRLPIMKMLNYSSLITKYSLQIIKKKELRKRKKQKKKPGGNQVEKENKWKKPIENPKKKKWCTLLIGWLKSNTGVARLPQYSALSTRIGFGPVWICLVLFLLVVVKLPIFFYRTVKYIINAHSDLNCVVLFLGLLCLVLLSLSSPPITWLGSIQLLHALHHHEKRRGHLPQQPADPFFP